MKGVSLNQFIKTYWLALFTFLLFLFVTLLIFEMLRDWTERRNKNYFEFRTTSAEAAIERRLAYYIQLLNAGKAFYNNTDTLTRKGWKKFVSNLQVDSSFPGVQGLGFAQYIPKEFLSRHIAQIKSEGFSDYQIRPEGSRKFYTSIIFLEPFDWRNRRAFGYDMFTESVRREAMIRARDYNVPALSGKVLLEQETDKDVQPGFLIYIPVYKNGESPSSMEERRKLIEGFIYSPFRAKDLVQGVLENEFRDIEIEIFDGNPSPETFLYNSDSKFDFKKYDRDHNFQKVSKIPIAGRVWTIFFSTEDYFDFSTENNLSYIVLIGGSIISVLIFFIMYAILNSRLKQEKSNKEIQMNAKMLEEANEKLSRQNNQLIRINNDLDNFIYTASHDLKAPILNIEGLTYALKDYTENKEIKELVNLMEDSVRRFKTTIFDLTEISRAQKSNEEEDQEIIFGQILDEITLDIKDLISLTHARISSDFSQKPSIRFSRKNIRSILYNLVSNAIKYRSSDRVPEVNIRTNVENDSVIITVEDNGLGISSKNQDKIFSMFKRMHDHVEGSGVGLYIVKRIVDNAGGTIDLNSEPGKGSIFKIKLPEK